MMIPLLSAEVFAAGPGPRRRGWGRVVLIAAGTAVAFWSGCTKPEEEVPPAAVKTVEAYGVTLDAAATPSQVAYVLLRSLADDVQAAQAHEHEKQKAALKLTYSLAAYSEIEQRLLNVINQDRAEKKTDLGDERDRRLFDFTRQWAPIVAHYVRSFDTDLQEAVTKMQEEPDPEGQRTSVLYAVSHDPTETAPAKQQQATLEIELIKETVGGLSYWRVARVGYRGRKAGVRPPPSAPPAATATAPAGGN